VYVDGISSISLECRCVRYSEFIYIYIYIYWKNILRLVLRYLAFLFGVHFFVNIIG